MSSIPRRAFLGFLLGGGTLAVVGASMTATPAVAAPMDAAVASLITPPTEKAAVRTTCWWSRGRRICRRHRLRYTCWWRGGRRICGWR